MEMDNEPPPPVQEVIANAEQPNRANSPDSIDEQLPDERSRRNRDRGHSATRRREKNAPLINLILGSGTNAVHGRRAMVIVSPNKRKNGRISKRNKIFGESSSCQIIDPYADRLRFKELELHKKNTEIVELMIKSNLPSETIKEFISKASFD